MLITVGGTISSGKTTLAEGIAERFKFKHISAGEIMRKLASERGVDIMEFSKYAEGNFDVDHEIDERQRELVRDYLSEGYGVIADGRLSAHLLDPNLKIWLSAPLKVRVERIMKRENCTRNDAVKRIAEREGSERRRYKNIYNIHLDDLSIYDLILNTEKWSVEGMIEVIANAIEKAKV